MLHTAIGWYAVCWSSEAVDWLNGSGKQLVLGIGNRESDLFMYVHVYINMTLCTLPPYFVQPPPLPKDIPSPIPCPSFVEDIRHHCVTFSDEPADRLMRSHGQLEV